MELLFIGHILLHELVSWFPKEEKRGKKKIWKMNVLCSILLRILKTAGFGNLNS